MANMPKAILFNDQIEGLSTNTRTKYMITQGKKTRFRFINLSAFTQFFVWFSSHKVTVIEVDGILIQEIKPTEGFVVSPGQRVSVLLEPQTLTGIYKIMVALGQLKTVL